MELEDLKSNWQNSGSTIKTETDLQKMTKLKRHPSIKKIRVKLIVETIALIFFLLIYYDWFDGDKKSFIINVLLVTSVLLYLLNDVIGYVALLRPVRGINLKVSIQNYLVGIKRISVFSLAVSFLYSICIIVFFTSVIQFTNQKKLLLAGIIIVLVASIFSSYIIWGKWVTNLKKQVNELNFEEE